MHTNLSPLRDSGEQFFISSQELEYAFRQPVKPNNALSPDEGRLRFPPSPVNPDDIEFVTDQTYSLLSSDSDSEYGTLAFTSYSSEKLSPPDTRQKTQDCYTRTFLSLCSLQ